MLDAYKRQSFDHYHQRQCVPQSDNILSSLLLGAEQWSSGWDNNIYIYAREDSNLDVDGIHSFSY